MSTRLAKGGRLIDRTAAMDFHFNGKVMRGYAGDTLAAALLANDQMLIGRSFKYHRPRGVVGSVFSDGVADDRELHAEPFLTNRRLRGDRGMSRAVATVTAAQTSS